MVPSRPGIRSGPYTITLTDAAMPHGRSKIIKIPSRILVLLAVVLLLQSCGYSDGVPDESTAPPSICPTPIPYPDVPIYPTSSGAHKEDQDNARLITYTASASYDEVLNFYLAQKNEGWQFSETCIRADHNSCHVFESTGFRASIYIDPSDKGGSNVLIELARIITCFPHL